MAAVAMAVFTAVAVGTAVVASAVVASAAVVSAVVAGDPASSLALARLGAGAAILMDITTTITPRRAVAGRPCAAGTIITGFCAAPGVAGDTAEIKGPAVFGGPFEF